MHPRSVLCVPGSSERMVAKALATAADEVVIDLEDAVAPSAKADARHLVVAVLRGLDPGRPVAVRVNAPGTPWAHEDLIALGSLPSLPHSVVVPKVESAGDLAFVDRLLRGVESSRRPLRVQALIESPAGLTYLPEIVRATPRLSALLLGYADLGAALRRGRSLPAAQWVPAQERLVWAARAAGLVAIDGPHLGVQVDDTFQAAVSHAAAVGFDAKWVLHPQQIDTVNTAFAPAEQDLAWARRVVSALDDAQARGLGAVQLDGAMLDEAVALDARRILTRAALP